MVQGRRTGSMVRVHVNDRKFSDGVVGYFEFSVAVASGAFGHETCLHAQAREKMHFKQQPESLRRLPDSPLQISRNLKQPAKMNASFAAAPPQYSEH